MSYDTSLFDHDAGYYEFLPTRWLPGQMVPDGRFTWSQKAVDAAVNLDLKDSDVICATYPKTGQTWTLTMIRLMMVAEELEEGKNVDMPDILSNIPFIETEMSNGTLGADIFNGLQSIRHMKTHLPYDMWRTQLQKHPNLKVIQTIRNPKDTLVSYFHHFRSDPQLGAFNGTWNQYFELFKQKRLPWGDYFLHNAEWYKFNKDREQSLILSYEDMKKSHRDHVVKISKFLEYDLSEKSIDLIVEKSSLRHMSKVVNSDLKELLGWKSERSAFVRKGEVGDWVNYFSKEQSQYVDDKCKQYLEPLGLKFEYKSTN